MHLSALTQTAPGLAYRVFGSQGDPVLFIMGLNMRGAVWTQQVEALREELRCCYYDHLGVGDSDPAPRFPTIVTMAADAIRILDDLGWERAHVVGVSMGGMIAQELALLHPGRCSTLTLIATHGGGPGATIPTLRGMVLFLQGILFGQKTRYRTLPKLLYPKEFRDEIGEAEVRKHMSTRLAERPDRRTVLGQVRAARQHYTEDRLRELTMPVMLVRPGKDILIRPAQIDRLAASIPDARVLRFDDAGHGVTFQKRDELNAALREHFRQDGARASIT